MIYSITKKFDHDVKNTLLNYHFVAKFWDSEYSILNSVS